MGVIGSPVLIGGGKTFAVISVTYTPGRTCICSNGTKTFAAKDTSGAYTFLIPSAGEWTVSDGILSKSILISTQYQTEKVNLLTLYLYNKGNECVSATGGWTQRLNSSYYSAGTMTKGTSNITISASGTKLVYSETVNGIDFTNFNTLFVNVTQNITGGTYKVHNISVFDGATAERHEVAHTNITGMGLFEVDISELDGLYYPSIMVSTEENTVTNTIVFDSVSVR